MQVSADVDPRVAWWDKHFAAQKWARYPPEPLVRFMARHFGRVSDKSRVRVLEIGCGPGTNLWYLAREGFSVCGVDCSRIALTQAAAWLRAENLDRRLDLECGDFSSLPWPDAHFDAVVDVEALYANDMNTISATLAEIERVLRPGGVFFGIMFGRNTTGYAQALTIEPGTAAYPDEGPCKGQAVAHFFSQDELRHLFRDFVDLRIDWVERSEGNQQYVVSEWLVSARNKGRPEAV